MAGNSPDPRAPADLTQTLDEDALSALAPLGLSRSAAAAYQHILLADEWSVEELPTALGIDREASVAALDELVAKALIVPSQEAKDALRPVAPAAGFTTLIRNQDAQIRARQDDLAKAQRSVEQLVAAFNQRDASRRASLEQIFGRDQIADRVMDLTQHAETEVLTLLTLLPSTAALTHARLADQALLERGVQTRMVVLAGHLQRSREFADHLRLLTVQGADVRVVTTALTRMIIVDRKAAVVPADPDEPGSAAVIFHQPGLIRLVVDAFQTAWDSGTLLEEAATRPAGPWQPTELEREVIKLLGGGHKDEAIARKVGLSLRSVRRIISNVSSQLGAGSRFSLGVLCRRQNLVP